MLYFRHMQQHDKAGVLPGEQGTVHIHIPSSLFHPHLPLPGPVETWVPPCLAISCSELFVCSDRSYNIKLKVILRPLRWKLQSIPLFIGFWSCFIHSENQTEKSTCTIKGEGIKKRVLCVKDREVLGTSHVSPMLSSFLCIQNFIYY